MPLNEAVISVFNQTSNCDLKTHFKNRKRKGKKGLNCVFLHYCVVNSANIQNDCAGRKEGDRECTNARKG